MIELKIPTVRIIERLPWAVRGLLGCCAAVGAVALTYYLQPLRAFPLLLAFPTVILSAWYLGMAGGICAAITEAILVDSFLTRAQFRFSIGNATEQLRLGTFLVISILLGWAIRRLAQQRAELGSQDLQKQLSLAQAQRQLAEERAHATDALRDRDEMLQMALQANGMGLWVWDLQQGSVHRSDQMYRIVGRDPESFNTAPETWLPFIHPDDLAEVMGAMHQTRDNGGDYHKQYRVIWPDGSVHWVESQGKCQRNSEGRITRLVGVMQDITHRKRAEEAMLRAEKLAVAGRLAASVAHEINNPLEAVANLLYLANTSNTFEEARTFGAQALDELMRVSLITQQTLKFHRQSGPPVATQLSEVVENVLTLFRGKLRASQIDVRVDAEHEAPIDVMPGEMQQIFANLVSNSIEAMPRGGRLAIRLRRSSDWRDRSRQGMRIVFCDSGTGMDRQTLRRTFEPFFTTKPETGTGLGMWVVAQLVERHHGHVRVWSTQREGRSGTAISVFLPFGEAAARSTTERAVAQAPG